jgi:CMP-N-acetylneuraminic acid synthetase
MTLTHRPPKVTVYVPCHNYGRFLDQALASIEGQTLESWEILVIDDGSVDDTAAIADGYARRLKDRVRVFRNEQARGLPFCSNLAFDQARGEFVIRLDADDYFDENALLVLASYLDRHPNVALVYPNYTYVDEQGKFLGVEQRKKVGAEALLLDLPAHGACTMVRRRVLKSIGGYDEKYDAQDGYQLWLKILHRHKGQVGNVGTPLFFYRQHSSSLSTNQSRILTARQSIKRGLVSRSEGPVKPRIVAVIGAKNTYADMPDVVFGDCAGKPLIDYSLDGAVGADIFDSVFVTTDDQRIVDYCAARPGVIASLRSPELSLPHVRLSEVLNDAVTQLERDHDIYPDIVVLLSVFTPQRRSSHIREAVDTLLAYDCDSVISVYEEKELHFTHGKHGLEPFNRGMIQKLRLEREGLYVDNQAIHALWRDVLTEHDLYGQAVSHITMTWEESLQARSPLEMEFVGQLIQRSRDAGRASRFREMEH